MLNIYFVFDDSIVLNLWLCFKLVKPLKHISDGVIQSDTGRGLIGKMWHSGIFSVCHRIRKDWRWTAPKLHGLSSGQQLNGPTGRDPKNRLPLNSFKTRLNHTWFHSSSSKTVRLNGLCYFIPKPVYVCVCIIHGFAHFCKQLDWSSSGVNCLTSGFTRPWG